MTADEGDTREPVTKEVRLLVPVEKNQAHPKRVSYGVVLEPDTEDLQGDVMSAEDIEEAAYDWMERSQSGGHMHTQLVEGAKVVESYIAPSDIPIDTPGGQEIIRKGSWVLAMRWPQEIWSSIEKGDLTGYSVGGTGLRLALEEIGKHGHHDQSTHGNWARDRMTPAEEGNAAGRADMAHAEDEDPPYEKNDYVGDVDASRSSAEMKDLLIRGHATLDGVRRNKDGTCTATRAFAQKGELDTEARFARAIEYAAGQQNLDVRILAADEYGERTGEGGRFEVRFSVRPKEPVGKHGHHDQSTHGNWAHPGAKSPRLQAWERYLTAPTPEQRRAAGDEYARLADEDDARGGYTGLKPDSYVTFQNGTKAKIVSIHEDGAIEVKSPDLPGSGDMLLVRGQIDSEGNVDLAPKTHPGSYEGTSAYGGMDPATRGAAAEGGGTPADQGAAAAADEKDHDKEPTYRQFTRGQKVRDNYGKTHRVLFQRGSQVFLDDSSQWIHPNNLWPVKKNDDPNEPVEEPLTEVVRAAFQEVAKDKGWAPGPNAGWRRTAEETGKPYTNHGRH